MKLRLTNVWLHWRGLGQGFERENQTPERDPQKAASERVVDQQSINGTTHSQQGATDDWCQPAVTPLFINNGE